MNQSLVESIYGRSSIQTANIVPIRLQTWSPKALIVSGGSISKNIFSSDVACPNAPKLGWKHASYHILVHLATRFQRRRFCKKSTSHKDMPMRAMFVNGSGRN
jgi:hypothetical protein